MPNSKFNQLLRKEMTRKDFLGLSAVTVASLFGIIGVLSELLSHAATPYASAESEDGTLTGGATIISDATASAGKAVTFGGSIGAYATAVAALPSLALWLPLDETSGTVAVDHSTNGYNGAYASSGVSYGVIDNGAASGVDNKAVTLGNSATVSIPNHPALRLACTLSSAWTLSVRIMIPSSNTGPITNPGYPFLVRLGDGGSDTGFQLFYSPNYETIGIHIGGSTAPAVSINSLQSTFNTITVTWNGSSLSYYQNGILIGNNSPSTLASITDTTDPFILGPNVSVDQVFITNECATAATVAALYSYYTTDGVPTFTAESAPAGVNNVGYSYQFTANGVSPISYSYSGILPAGLHLSSSGLLSGTPSVVGSSIFTVIARNSAGSTNSTTQMMSVTATETTVISFSKGTVWQTDNIQGTFGTITSSGALAAVTKDASDMQTAGITWVRWWGNNVTSDVVKIVTIFKSYGITMIYCFNLGMSASSSTEAAVIAALQALVPQCAAAGLHVWEIGNEPNINYQYNGYWDTGGSAAYAIGGNGAGGGNYALRLKDAYTTIHGLDASAFVLSAGISYNPSYTDYDEVTSTAWFQEFTLPKYGLWNYCDGIGLHPYAPPAGSWAAACSEIRGYLSSEFAAKPIIITESGMWWPGGGNTYASSQPGEVSSEATRNSDYISMMNELKANGLDGGRSPLCWYTWYDYTDSPGYGVVTWNGSTSNPTGRTPSSLYTTIQNYNP
jgi:hypothetical protein